MLCCYVSLRGESDILSLNLLNPSAQFVIGPCLGSALACSKLRAGPQLSWAMICLHLYPHNPCSHTKGTCRKGAVVANYQLPCSIRRTPTRNITFRSLRKGPCGALHHVFLCIRPLVKTHYWFFFAIEVLSYNHNSLHEGLSLKALSHFLPMYKGTSTEKGFS